MFSPKVPIIIAYNYADKKYDGEGFVHWVSEFNFCFLPIIFRRVLHKISLSVKIVKII